MATIRKLYEVQFEIYPLTSEGKKEVENRIKLIQGSKGMSLLNGVFDILTEGKINDSLYAKNMFLSSFPGLIIYNNLSHKVHHKFSSCSLSNLKSNFI